MATSRSPFKEDLVNRSTGAASPNTSVLPSEGWMFPEQQEDEHDNGSNDENTIGANFSHSPTKRSTNVIAVFNSQEKRPSIDASTITAMRTTHSVIDVSATTSSSFVEEDDHPNKNEALLQKVDQLLEILPSLPPSPPKTPNTDAPTEEPSPQQDLVAPRQQQQPVMNNFSGENPFDGIDSRDDSDAIEQKPKEQTIQVETVTSQDTNSHKESRDENSKQEGVDLVSNSVELFDVTSESLVDVPTAATLSNEFENDVFKEVSKVSTSPGNVCDSIIVQNPFEQYMQTSMYQESEDSYVFSQPASEESDELRRYPMPCNSKSPVEPDFTLLAQSSDAFIGVESNIIDSEHDPEDPLSLKPQSDSSGETRNYTSASGPRGGANADDKSAFDSCITSDTYGPLASSTAKTLKMNNLGILPGHNEASLRPTTPKEFYHGQAPSSPRPSPPVTPGRERHRGRSSSPRPSPPLTPKERYLAAIKQSSGSKLTEPMSVVSPKDRYLMAVREAASKCKTPTKEIVSTRPLTPSSVKQQVERVEKGGFRGALATSPDLVCSSEPNDCALFIPRSSPERSFYSAEEEEEEPPVEFGSPLFENETSTGAFPAAPGKQEECTTKVLGRHADWHEKQVEQNVQPRRPSVNSAFHSFHHQDGTNDSSNTSGKLVVREQIDVGNPTSPVKSYLQLDVEATEPARKLGVEDNESSSRSNNQSFGSLGPIDTLRSSLATIWNSKPIPRLSGSGTQGEPPQRGEPSRKRRSDQYGPVRSPPGAKASRSLEPEETQAQPLPDPTGAMESLRSSLRMIWTSTTKAEVLASASAHMKSKLSAELEKETTKDVESQVQERSSRSPRDCELSDGKRERVFSEDSSDASSYRRTQKKKTRRNEGLSARPKPLPEAPAKAMGRQYLMSSQRGRPQSRERTVTPIPTDDDLYDPGLLGIRASHDSVDDAPLDTKCAAVRPYMNSALARYTSTPSPVTGRPVSTNESEDSFINAALKARSADDVLAIYSATPDKRDWHPPEQERKEHDTMVRAILEQPSLIDKSIRDSRHQSNYTDWRKVRKWVLIGIAVLLFVATIAGCLACGITGACGRRDVEKIKEVEEVQPLVLNLPIYTQESLKSLHTAQTKAYFWLGSDPNRSSYSTERMLQRFALATLYYSTKIAQNWTVSTSWLSYDIHECYWFSSYEGMDVCEDDKIKHLVLKKNNLRGNVPPEVALLTSLVELDLSRNVLIGPIPEQLEALTNLEVLWLEKNELNGNIPSQIASLTSLTSLALATNDLKGAIPSQLAKLTDLKKLRLFYNYLTGELPTEVGLLTNLEVLDVDVNHLSGLIPTQLGRLENLKELWLDWNSFVGPIPTELGLLSNLEKLYFGRAFVEDDLRDEDWRGSGDYVIPSEFGQLNNLQELYLDNNNLTGMIPRELSSLTNLQRATLDNNLLTDSISPGICALFGGGLESLSVDCAEVLCSCGCTCL